MESDGTQDDGQPAISNLDEDHVLTRLQVGSSQDERVHAKDDGGSLSHGEIIQHDNPKDECSIFSCPFPWFQRVHAKVDESDGTPSKQKPTKFMLATKGKKVKRVTFKDPVVEYGQVKTEVPKVMKELPVYKIRSQSGCPLGLSHYQLWKLKRLSAGELEKRNMAWIPKRNSQAKKGAPASLAKPAGVKEDK